MSKKFKNLDLDNQLCFALYAATHAITRSYRAKLDHVGITYPQYLVLLVLWEKDMQTIKELALRLQLDSGTLTPLIKRIETAGFVKRERNKQDERVVTVSLTKEGKALEKSVAKIQQEIVCQTGLSESEFFKLRDSLYKLTKTMSKDLKCDAVSA